MEYKRKPSESLDEYRIRLCQNKDLYDLRWQDISELWYEETSERKSPDWFRKFYRYFSEGYEYALKVNSPNEEYIKELEEKKIEFEKAKYQYQDQKREYRKLIANQARFEHLRDEIIKAIADIGKSKPLAFTPRPLSPSDKEGLVLFSDWHFGMEVDNTVNKFNKEVFDKRVKKLVEKTIEYGKQHNIKTLHVAQLGDLLSGNIHISTRVQSNENIIQQVQYVSEVLSEILAAFANEFENVKYYNVIGNHGRAGQKQDVGIKENFEYLIPWYIEARLKGFDNIEIVVDEDGFICANIKGKQIIFVHGNFDRIDNAVTRLPQMLGYIPDFIIGGHIHHHYEKEYGKTTIITNGSLIGVDDYAMQNRFYAKPSQKFMVFNDEDLECTYNIKLN
jgi:hypothetical protein